MNNGPSISIGLGARNLRDRDWLSKSDPYIVVSRPSTSGSFQVLRKSETKKNCLNPDWADFLLTEREVGPHEQELRLKFEIFDNDYNSADQLLGVTHLSLKQLEAAATLRTSLKIGGIGNGKVNAGSLVVRSFSRHGVGGQGGYIGQQSQFAEAGALGGGHQGQIGQAGPLGGGHQGQLGQAGAYKGQSSPSPLPFSDPCSIFFSWLPICTNLQCSNQPIHWAWGLCFPTFLIHQQCFEGLHCWMEANYFEDHVDTVF